MPATLFGAQSWARTEGQSLRSHPLEKGRGRARVALLSANSPPRYLAGLNPKCSRNGAQSKGQSGASFPEAIVHAPARCLQPARDDNSLLLQAMETAQF